MEKYFARMEIKASWCLAMEHELILPIPRQMISLIDVSLNVASTESSAAVRNFELFFNSCSQFPICLKIHRLANEFEESQSFTYLRTFGISSRTGVESLSRIWCGVFLVLRLFFFDCTTKFTSAILSNLTMVLGNVRVIRGFFLNNDHQIMNLELSEKMCNSKSLRNFWTTPLSSLRLSSLRSAHSMFVACLDRMWFI